MKNKIHVVKAAFLKALAHPVRLQILEILCRGESSVGQFTQSLGVDQPTVSRHLGILKQGGLVVARQEGLLVLYKIQNKDMAQFLQKLAELLRRKLQIDRKILKSLGEL
jgi:ArsR family transcriptional regulator